MRLRRRGGREQKKSRGRWAAPGDRSSGWSLTPEGHTVQGGGRGPQKHAAAPVRPSAGPAPGVPAAPPFWGGEWRQGVPSVSCSRAPRGCCERDLPWPIGAAQRGLLGNTSPSSTDQVPRGSLTRWRTPSPPAAMTGGGPAPYRTRRRWTCVCSKSLGNALACRHRPLACRNLCPGDQTGSVGPAQEGFWGLRGCVPPQAGSWKPTRRPVLPGPIESRRPGLCVSSRSDTGTASPNSPRKGRGGVW